MLARQSVKPSIGLREEEDGEVHGTAFCMDRENEARLDRVEGLGIAYRKERVNLRGYDGAQMEGFVYLPLVDMEGLPSARYHYVLHYPVCIVHNSNKSVCTALFCTEMYINVM